MNSKKYKLVSLVTLFVFIIIATLKFNLHKNFKKVPEIKSTQLELSPVEQRVLEEIGQASLQQVQQEMVSHILPSTYENKGEQLDELIAELKLKVSEISNDSLDGSVSASQLAEFESLKQKTLTIHQEYLKASNQYFNNLVDHIKELEKL
jgi:hypothetical protein